MFADKFYTPDGRVVDVVSSVATLFSDDFGGTSVDTTGRWQVLDGGQGAVTLSGGVQQAAIGSGITGITDSVASSALTVSMGTTTNAERWYLSKQIFGAAEDVLVILSKSQAITQNSIFVGLVEVGPDGIPLLNPNLAGDFTNRGGVEFGLTATTTAFQCEAVAESSGAKAVGSVGVAAALTGTQEFVAEIHAEDIICSPQAVDSVAGKLQGCSRVSTQCPSDNKKYKLLMRFKNVGTPGSGTSVVIQRVCVVARQEMRVEIASGRGDFNAQKAVAVNVASALPAGSNLLGNVNLYTNSQAGGSIVPVANAITSGGITSFRLTSAATTNPISIKGSFGAILSGQVVNTGTTAAFLKFYNKATAPTVGTDIPVVTLMLPATAAGTNAAPVNIAEVLGIIGYKFGTGIGMALTGAYADSDTTAIAAGQVNLNLFYI
jgi:hypothetical protein